MNSPRPSGETINSLIDAGREKFADLFAIGMAFEEPLTYAQLHESLLVVAAALRRDGVERGDHVAILAENSHSWGIAYFAIVRLGAVAVPILPDLPESDVHHILNEMQVKILFTTQRQIEKIYELKHNHLTRVITLDNYEGAVGIIKVDAFSGFLAEARLVKEKAETDGSLLFSEVDEDDLASILYTSGTSGYSKAVMLSHKNLMANAWSASKLIECEPGSVFLSILPMSHTYEFTLGFTMPLLKGGQIVYAGKTPTPAILQKICKEVKPYAMFAVPLVMEKIYKKRVLPNVEGSWMLRKLVTFAPGRRFIYKKIGAKLLQFFGGNLQVMGIGGAGLNPEVEKFLYEAGFPYLAGYGLTESAPLLAGGPVGDQSITVGSCGKPIPGVEIRIVGPDSDTGIGEIYGRGDNVMQGYYGDQESTDEVLSDDGWLATGDLGFVDDIGNLHICGRCKNVIVMANGENVYPEPIEHKMNSYQWVMEALVVDNNGQLNGWIYPDYELIDEMTEGKSRRERREFIDTLLLDMRKDVNSQLSSASRLKRVVERREPFIKTATHKIKRYLYDSGALDS